MLCLLSVAQQNDNDRAVVLKEVIVYEDLLKSAEIGLSEIKIDSITLSQAAGSNITDLLRNTAAGQIRSYGTNGLTLPAFRGTGAEQTAILWNGINLQSPLYGGQDLSLIPNSFINEVILQKGGTSSLYGSGAIGGSIQLNNKTYFNKGLQLTANQKIGSYSNHYQSYGISLSNASFSNVTDVFFRKMKNDYEYFNTYSNPRVKEKRVNAEVNQKGIVQQNDWRINSTNIIGIKIWYQTNEIEIPNSIIATDNNEALQNDEFTRILLSWSHDSDRLSLTYKQAYIWHKLYYEPSVGDSSKSIFSTWVNRVEVNLDLNERNELILGANHNFDRANVDAFGSDKPTRNSTAVFASLRSKNVNEKLLTALSFREEVIDFKNWNFAPSLGMDYKVFDDEFLGQFWIKGNLSRNYRIPTLNNLYWNGSGAQGNADLRSELSNNFEFGLKHNLTESHSSVKLTSAITYYHYLVDNWIQWQQTTSDLWTPINLKKVLSKGLESSISANYRDGDYSANISLAYNYTKTINKKIVDDASPDELKKQLIYTPLHEGSINLQFGYKNSLITINHTYTGLQYSDGGNKDRFALPSYQITNVYLNHSLKYNKFNLAVQAETNNLLDIAYENRRGYPMYGRNYSISLLLNFKNQKTK